jgi:hypothetical protein
VRAEADFAAPRYAVPISTVIINQLPAKSVLMTGKWRAREYQNKATLSIEDVSNDTFDYPSE